MPVPIFAKNQQITIAGNGACEELAVEVPGQNSPGGEGDREEEHHD